MQTSFPNLTILTLFGVCAALCAVPARSFASSQIANPESSMRLCSFTHDLAYLFTPAGPVDVTNTLHTSGGITYVMYQGTAIAVMLDYTNATIRDTTGAVIGFIQHVVDEDSGSVPRSIHNNAVRRNSRTLRYQMPFGSPARHSKQAPIAQIHDLA